MTQLLALNCNSCGAPIEVPSKVRYFTCEYCECKLEVKRSESAAYTEVLEEVKAHAEEIADRMEIIELQNELERLDRAWDRGRERYRRRPRNERDDTPMRVPSKAWTGFGAIAVAAFGVFWTIMAISIEAPFFFPLFGIFFVVMAISQGFAGMKIASEYESRSRRYRKRRREILKKMRDARDGS